jgi:hypothetical protein
MFFFELRIKQEDLLRELRWDILKTLLEKITCSFQFRALESVEELDQISLPNVKHMRPSEKLDTALVCLKIIWTK